MMIFQHRIPLVGEPRSVRGSELSALDGASEQSVGPSRGRRALSAETFSALGAALARSTTRQVVMYHAATVGILGGVVCTPLISVVAWVGMVLPETATLHQLAPVLMTTALVWLALAIILAHACRPARERRMPGPLSNSFVSNSFIK